MGESVTISSKEGIQQGDPLDPALFSVAIQPVLVALQHNHVNMVLTYLDDTFTVFLALQIAPLVPALH